MPNPHTPPKPDGLSKAPLSCPKCSHTGQQPWFQKAGDVRSCRCAKCNAWITNLPKIESLGAEAPEKKDRPGPLFSFVAAGRIGLIDGKVTDADILDAFTVAHRAEVLYPFWRDGKLPLDSTGKPSTGGI